RPIQCRLVAGRTAHVALQRPPRIEEQHPSQSHPSRSYGEFWRLHCLRQRSEEGLCLREEYRIVFGVEPVGYRDEQQCRDDHGRTGEPPTPHTRSLHVVTLPLPT